MGKYITLGQYNNQYKYILLYILFALINICLYNLNYYDVFKGIKLLWFDLFKIDKTEFVNYSFIRQIIFSYFGTFILAGFSLIYEKIKTNREKRNKSKEKRPSTIAITLIHEEHKEIMQGENRISLIYFMLIIFGWVFEEQAIDKYNSTLCHLDFWMFELIIIAYLNSKMLHIEIYKHQKFVLIFSLIPIFFKIITIILEFEDKEHGYFVYEREGNFYWVPLGLFIYIVFIALKGYIIIKIKWLMDSKYFSEKKLLMFYGLIGTCFYSIFSIISSLTEYENNYIFIGKQNGFKYYFEVFSESNITQIIIEIIVFILGMIISYFIKYNFIMIVKYLTPVHIVFLTPIFYFVSKVLLVIYNIIFGFIVNDYSQLFDKTKMDYLYEKFSLDILGDVFSFFGFLIYLEIIVLNCFGFNYNLRTNIIDRAMLELMHINDSIETTNDDEDDDDDEDVVRNHTNNSMEELVDISKISIFSK